MQLHCGVAYTALQNELQSKQVHLYTVSMNLHLQKDKRTSSLTTSNWIMMHCFLDKSLNESFTLYGKKLRLRSWKNWRRMWMWKTTKNHWECISIDIKVWPSKPLLLLQRACLRVEGEKKKNSLHTFWRACWHETIFFCCIGCVISIVQPHDICKKRKELVLFCTIMLNFIY